MLYMFEAISQIVGLPVGLLAAVCTIESGNNPNAIHPADGGSSSIGICQIKYKTARTVMPKIQPSDLFNPEINALAAALYLKKQMTRYNNNIDQAIAAYNRGSVKYIEGRLTNTLYVQKVKKEWKNQKLKASVARLISSGPLSPL